MGDTAYRRFVLLRLVFAFWAVWAFIGTYYYEELLKYLGWQSIGIELRLSIFLGLTIFALGLVSAIAFGAYRYFRPAGKRRSV